MEPTISLMHALAIVLPSDRLSAPWTWWLCWWLILIDTCRREPEPLHKGGSKIIYLKGPLDQFCGLSRREPPPWVFSSLSGKLPWWEEHQGNPEQTSTPTPEGGGDIVSAHFLRFTHMWSESNWTSYFPPVMYLLVSIDLAASPALPSHSIYSVIFLLMSSLGTLQICHPRLLLQVASWAAPFLWLELP